MASRAGTKGHRPAAVDDFVEYEAMLKRVHGVTRGLLTDKIRAGQHLDGGALDTALRI